MVGFCSDFGQTPPPDFRTLGIQVYPPTKDTAIRPADFMQVTVINTGPQEVEEIHRFEPKYL